MKKDIGFTLMAIFITANVWGDQVKPGQYFGINSSIQSDQNGKDWIVNVKLEKGYNIADAKMVYQLENRWGSGNYSVQWTWDENTLEIIEQLENTSGSKRSGLSYIKKYSAKNEDGKYIINCKNRELGDCGGLDPNHYWKIIATENGFIWESWGVPLGETGDPIKMDSLTFKLK